MRRLTLLSALLLVAAVLFAAGAAHASLLHGFSKEQLFLMERRQLISLPDGVGLTRALPPPSVDTIADMPTSQLRHLLSDHQLSCDGCLERGELVDTALQGRHTPSRQAQIAQQLTLTDPPPIIPGPVYNDHMLILAEALTGRTCALAKNGTLTCA